MQGMPRRRQETQPDFESDSNSHRFLRVLHSQQLDVPFLTFRIPELDPSTGSMIPVKVGSFWR